MIQRHEYGTSQEAMQWAEYFLHKYPYSQYGTNVTIWGQNHKWTVEVSRTQGE